MRRLLIFILSIGLMACSKKGLGEGKEEGEGTLELTRFPMATYVTIKVWGQSDILHGAVDKAFTEIDRVDSLTSVFSTHSAVYELNNSGEITSDEIAGLLGKAHQVWEQSDGAFDPTVKPLIELWGFYDSLGRDVPSREKLSDVLRFVGFNNLEISGDTVTLRDFPGSPRENLVFSCGVDLGGIAKGYAVDRAVEVLRKQEVYRGLVDAGGDIYCFGTKKGDWKIGIRDPRADNPGNLLGVINIDSGAVATSGDYENYFEVDGVRFHHLINPRTGYPARRAISATVLAPTVALADAWATALFILGEEGIDVLNTVDGLEGLIVLKDGSQLMTRGFPPLVSP